MNKKFLVLGVMGLFLVGIVAAIGYYAMFSTSFVVESAIVTTGNTEQDLGIVFSGGLVEGEMITITNNAPSERTLEFSDETECDIETSYASIVDMNKKDSEWVIIPDTTIVLSYVFLGHELKYKVDTEMEDYVVVYYPDIDGNPGSWNIVNAELVGDVNTEWTSSDVEVLPNEEDWNHAAKLWLIPSADWNAQSWNPSEWYFENNLVTYGDEVILEAESSMSVTPLYEIAVGETGECTVTTTVA